MGRRHPCPRCGSFSYEKLKTHAHCPNCLYSPDIDDYFERQIPDWTRKYLPKDSEISLEAALEEAVPKVSLDLSLKVAASDEPREESERQIEADTD